VTVPLKSAFGVNVQPVEASPVRVPCVASASERLTTERVSPSVSETPARS